MTHKMKAIIALAFSCACLLAACVVLVASCDRSTDAGVYSEDVLTGSQLRTLMNEAKYSPAASDIYIHDHPTYAWLFDGSFVTYVEN